MNIPGSGSKARGIRTLSARSSTGFKASLKAVHSGLSSSGMGGRPDQSETDSAWRAWPVDRPTEKIQSDGSTSRVRVHEGWVVLDARIEQVARPGLDHAGESPALECGPDQFDFTRQDEGSWYGSNDPASSVIAILR